MSQAYWGDGKELRAWLASRVGWEVGQDGWGLEGTAGPGWGPGSGC